MVALNLFGHSPRSVFVLFVVVLGVVFLNLGDPLCATRWLARPCMWLWWGARQNNSWSSNSTGHPRTASLRRPSRFAALTQLEK